MTTTNTNRAYKPLISLWEKLMRINGAISPEAINKLKDELEGVFTVVKMHHYEQGQKYRHLASIIQQNKYRLVIGNPTWTHTAPADDLTRINTLRKYVGQAEDQ